MRAAYFTGEGRIELREVPRPDPGEGELLVRVAACGVCGSDRKALRTGRELIPGHEVVGTVAEARAGCATREGARVAVYIPRHCGECEYCRRGEGNICPDRNGLLGWRTDGGYAQYMVVPDRNALPLADGLSFAEGVILLDTLGTSGHGVRLSGGEGSESALVIGAGPVGAGAVACLKAFGVADVFVAEPGSYRREKAAELGGIGIDPESMDLDAVVRQSYPHGVDVAVEAVGRLSTICQALDLVRPGGTVNVLGEYGGPVQLEHIKGSWMINDLTLLRSFYFTLPEFEANQRMVLEGRLPAAELATHEFPLERIAEAFELFNSGGGLKVLVRPE